MLARLQAGEFIYEHAVTGDVEYTFKHALTQEVAYHSLLIERRKLLHERAGLALESMFAAQLDDHLDELAHHYSRSDNVAKAVEYLGRAGISAAQQVAHSEAIGYLTAGLELLNELPGSEDRARQELDLQMALGWSLFVARGPLAPERESALVRARELCELLGDNGKLMEALLALGHFRLNQLDFELGRDLAARVLELAEHAKATAMLAGAHQLLGVGLFSTGQFEEARKHFERAFELFGAGPSRNLGAYLAQHAPHLLVAVLVILGCPSTAFSRFHDLLAAARRSSDSYAIATALYNEGMHHLVLRDSRMMAERADEMLSIATEHEMAIYTFQATFLRGWAMAAAGQGEEGIADMCRSVSDPKMAERPSTALMRAAVAEACGKNGRSQEGLAMVIDGLALAERTGLRIADAELHRLMGELTLLKDPGSETEVEVGFRPPSASPAVRRQGCSSCARPPVSHACS
jgi:tetratricopeptide (TPR) repeat protein